nr:nucleolar MIF4G domain-containing protein 1 [Loxodonta africana]
MKRKSGRGPLGGRGGGGQAPLKRLTLAVEEFVRATCEGPPPGSRAEGRGGPSGSRPGRRNSRRALKREKRHLRKARRFRWTAGPAQSPGPGSRGGARESTGPHRAPPTASRAPPTASRARPPPKKLRPPQAKAGAPKARAGPRGPPGEATPSSPATAAARKRALLAANEEEDREIRKLERRLGLNKRKKKGDGSSGSVPLSFARDGLGYILGALEPGNGSGFYESSSEEEEEAGQPLPERDPESDTEEGNEEEDAVEEGEEEGEEGAQSEEERVEEEAAADRGAQEKGGRRKKRVHFAEEEESEGSSEDGEATDESLCESGQKYIPPPVRRAEEKVDAQKKEELERLKKQVKGLVNSFQVGAHFLEAVVRKFDDVYKNGSEGKECDNLFSILAHLYNFHVVQPLLIFDILKKLIVTFTEKDIELILLMLKTVGFSLRKEDALSLKELIAEAQKKASGAGGRFQDQTRIRFMLETMLALKNNDMRKIPGYDPEPVEKLRKLQRALVRNLGSGTETRLRVSWESVLNAEQVGRWWIIGSSWSGAPMIDSSDKIQQKRFAGTVSSKILDLARKQRMNTDVRRNIFCAIMTSEDFLDAFEKLLKLGLKDQQEREVVHVLVDCCLQEKTYNPFYAFLASKFCEYERRFQMTFQFSIWDKFRDLENLPATNFSNLFHLVAHLLRTKSLPLSILKVVEFSELDKPRVHFLRQVLYMLLMETEVEDLCLIFARVSDNPKLGMLREGLKLFISHFLMKNVQIHRSAEEANLLRERADLATRSLQGKSSLRM